MYAALLTNPTNFIVHFYNQGNAKAQGLAERCYRELPTKKRRGLEFLEQQRQTSLFIQLETYLKNGQWREADEETTRLMLLIAKREDEGYLDVESIEKFPCPELRTIDKLWVDYSKGKFGFSVQKKVWIDCGGVPGEYDYDVYKKFVDQVGWRRSGVYVGVVSYEELIFLLDGSEKAHLPFCGFLGVDRIVLYDKSDSFVLKVVGLFSRATTCNL
jgi:hypothetical protein